MTAWTVLTLHQPWASLVVKGAKRYETRSWYTHHRGIVLIHSSTNSRKEIRAMMEKVEFRSALYGLTFDDLPRGQIIGMGYLNSVLDAPTVANAYRDCRELAFGDFSEGRKAWRFHNAIEFPPERRIPVRGLQGLWRLPTDLGDGVSYAEIDNYLSTMANQLYLELKD